MRISFASRPSSYLPLMMSGIVIAAMVWHLARFGLAHQVDEGTAAHVFQILMPLQVPIMIYFAARWLPIEARWASKVLAVQFALFAAIMAAVFFVLDR